MIDVDLFDLIFLLPDFYRPKIFVVFFIHYIVFVDIFNKLFKIKQFWEQGRLDDKFRFIEEKDDCFIVLNSAFIARVIEFLNERLLLSLILDKREFGFFDLG